VSGDLQCEELLLSCISYFNNKLSENNSLYKLSEKPDLYTLQIAKKSGKPKDDLPRIFHKFIIKK